MKSLKLFSTVFFMLAIHNLQAQEKPALGWKDVSKWTFNRPATLSPNGEWIALASGPVEGDLKMTIRKTNDTLSRNYPIGAMANSISFSNDSKFAALASLSLSETFIASNFESFENEMLLAVDPIV